MKLQVDEAKLNGFWVSNCATYPTGLDFKICLRAPKVSGPFEKRAPNPSHVSRSHVKVLDFDFTCFVFFKEILKKKIQ